MSSTTHSLTITHTYRDGLTERTTSPGHPGSAGGAQKHLMWRLRNWRKVTFQHGPGWVEYDEAPCKDLERTVRLQWEAEPGTGARWQPADLARQIRPQPGHVVPVECESPAGQVVAQDFLVRKVDRLGCGCYRLRGDRPGWHWANVGRMEVLTGCQVHRSGVLSR